MPPFLATPLALLSLSPAPVLLVVVVIGVQLFVAWAQRPVAEAININAAARLRALKLSLLEFDRPAAGL